MKPYSLMALLAILLPWACQEKAPSTFSAEIDTFYRDSFPETEPGAAVLAMKGDSIVFAKGYGLADLQSGEKITSATLFNTGSISKTFVAYGILILEEEGALSLEDSIGRYFPDFENREIARRVQLKHLLSHTSGLPDIREVDKNRDFFLSAKDEENWAPIQKADSLNFEPGQRFEYSNPAFNALALIIEQVSGQKWQDFIRERIFVPAGMPNSTITDGPHPQEGVAHAYQQVDGEYQEYDYGEYPTFAAAGNGGVWSSAEELARYELAIRRGAFLPDTAIEESRQIFEPANWADTIPPAIGWSWFITPPAPPHEKKIVYHTGSQGGFRAFHLSIPEKEILYVALFNRPAEVEPFMDKGVALMEKYGWLE